MAIRNEICDELKWIAAESPVPRTAPAAAPAGRPSESHGSALGRGRQSLIAASTVAAFAAWPLKPRRPNLSLALRSLCRLASAWILLGAAIAISPDGTRLVYAAGPSNLKRQLYVREMDGLDAHAHSRNRRCRDPFFSPDGQWVGFATMVESS